MALLNCVRLWWDKYTVVIEMTTRVNEEQVMPMYSCVKKRVAATPHDSAIKYAP